MSKSRPLIDAMVTAVGPHGFRKVDEWIEDIITIRGGGSSYATMRANATKKVRLVDAGLILVTIGTETYVTMGTQDEAEAELGDFVARLGARSEVARLRAEVDRLLRQRESHQDALEDIADELVEVHQRLADAKAKVAGVKA